MLRRTRCSRTCRIVAILVTITLPWLFGPAQVGEAATAEARRRAQREAGEARPLSLAEQRAIRGSATWPGTPREWQFDHATLGGYGQVNCLSGNHQIAIPVVGWTGKGGGLAFVLYHNSAATQTGYFFPTPRPPVANGWTHSYNIYLEGAGTSSVTVVEGDGSRNLFTRNMDGSFTAPAGVWDTLVLNPDGTYTLTRKTGLKLNFGSNHKIATVVDLNGNTVTVAYGANGHASTITDASGRSLSLGYTANSQLSTVTDPLSRVFSLTLDGNYHLQRITFPSPAAGQPQPYFEFGYNGLAGTVTSFRNRRGSVWSLAYSGTDIQAVTSVTDPRTKVLSVDYGMRRLTLENGAVYTWDTDASGNRATVALNGDFYHPNETQAWTWDSLRRMTTHTTGRGYVWEYTWDSKGNRLTVEDPVTRENPSIVKETWTYNGFSQPTSFIDALGRRTDWHRHATTGNLEREVDPLLYERTHTHDSAGLKLTTTDERGKVWRWVYDSYGNCTEAKDPNLNVTTSTFSLLGWLTSVTTPTAVRTDFTNDNLGRPTRATHASDPTYVATTFDAEDAVLTLHDELGRVTTNTVNNMGWVTATTDAKNQTTSFGHNDLGQRISLTNARNKTTTWTLDNSGRIVRIDYPDGTNEQFTWNADSLLASRTDGRGNVVSRGYDTVGRLNLVTYPDSQNTSIQYRANDLPSQRIDRTGTYGWTYSSRDQVTQATSPQGTVTYGYDPAKNRTSVSRGAGYAISTAYDDASHPSSMINGFSETTSFTRNASGQITQQLNSNGTKALCFYNAGRGWLDAIEHRKSDNSLLARYEYTRNATGRITVENQPGDHTTTYTLDEIYQLTREQRTGTLPYDHQFSYDATGNRLTKTTGAGTETSTYGDNDQILTAGAKSYQHDNDGNMTGVTVGGQTTGLQWDYNNKLKQITYPGGATNTFQTNDAGQRVSKTDSSGTTTCLFDSEEAAWAVLADSRADYTRGGVTGLISERQGSTSRFYHGDQLASTRGLTNTSQTITDTREFDAWGLLVNSTGTTATPFGFAGGHGYQRDPDSGLKLLGERYYDPSIGRFISRDPIGYEDGTNLYAYCGNDPMNHIDPTGNNRWRMIWELLKWIWERTRRTPPIRPEDLRPPPPIHPPGEVVRPFPSRPRPPGNGHGGPREGPRGGPPGRNGDSPEPPRPPGPPPPPNGRGGPGGGGRPYPPGPLPPPNGHGDPGGGAFVPRPTNPHNPTYD